MKPSRAIARQTVAHEQTAQTVQALHQKIDDLKAAIEELKVAIVTAQQQQPKQVK